MRLTRSLAALLAALLAAGSAAGADNHAVPEPEGYHAEPYQSPVPATLQGATVLDGPGAIVAARAGAVMIDVLPRKARPAGLPAGTIWREPGHDTIAGAIWLPDSGYAALATADADRFLAALGTLGQGDRSTPMVFFCKPDCWMSWNAAKRAIAGGFTAVSWFPGGVSAWKAAGGAVEPATPWSPP